MQPRVAAAGAACLLGGPAVVAFFSGGYYTQPRVIAAIVAWVLVLALALTGPAPLPRGRAGIAAVAGLALLTAWSALSITWAPLAGPAVEDVQRLLLYLGALLVAVGVLRHARALRALEPALAAGATLVITYGLSGRLLPGIVDLDRSRSAGGRLEQPITYWNGEGALAAVGLLLCARLAGDRSRHPALRTAAAAAAVPLGAGVYLSYSRGAIAGALLGLVVLVAAAPTRAQLRAALAALVAAVAAALACAVFPGVASLEGSSSDRIADGWMALAILAVLTVAAALTARRGSEERLPWARHLAHAAAAVVVVVAIALVAGGLGERASRAELARGASAGRLTTVNSNRYEYWRVAIRAFGREPLTGLGAGGFRTEWLKHRKIGEAVKDTHSIELEVATELGLVGLLAFGLMVGGVAAAGRTALRRRRELAAGPATAALVWLLHASIDWDWQLPAVTLPAIALAGGLIVMAESSADRAGDAGPAPAARSRDRPRATP